MKTVILSDIHVDFWWPQVVDRSRFSVADPDESVTRETLDYMWKLFSVPDADAIIVAGDISNDFLSFSYTVKWLSEKYARVIMVIGNHDMIVRGGTVSKSNLRFKTTEQKLAAMKDVCRQFQNVYLLEGAETSPLVKYNIGGCMGMCDFKCNPPAFGLDPLIRWRRKWFDGKFWRYFDRDPIAIWNHYDKLMDELMQFHPKVMVTHFVPFEIGIPENYRLDPLNYVYFFHAEKYLEEMNDDTYWICGHTHVRKRAEYVNSKGNLIHILCNPLGYPETRFDTSCEVMDFRGDKLVRTTERFDFNNFVINV